MDIVTLLKLRAGQHHFYWAVVQVCNEHCVWLCEWSAGHGREIQSLGLLSPGASLPSYFFSFLLTKSSVYCKRIQLRHNQMEGIYRARYVEKGSELPWPSSIPLYPDPHVFTSLEVLSSFSLRNSTYPSTANTTGQPFAPPPRHLCALGSAHWSFYLF